MSPFLEKDPGKTASLYTIYNRSVIVVVVVSSCAYIHMWRYVIIHLRICTRIYYYQYHISISYNYIVHTL